MALAIFFEIEITCSTSIFAEAHFHYSLVNSFRLVLKSTSLLPDVGVHALFWWTPTFYNFHQQNLKKINKDEEHMIAINKGISISAFGIPPFRHSSKEKRKCGGGHLHLRGSKEGALHRGQPHGRRISLPTKWGFPFRHDGVPLVFSSCSNDGISPNSQKP